MGDGGMDTAKAVERMKRHISDNIRGLITAKELADAAGYSQYHAARIFKDHTGYSPFEYIREQRLIHSALMLRSGDSKVIDIALDFVFGSHEGFTRAFTNAFGISPKRFSSMPQPSGWLIPFSVLNRRKKKGRLIKWLIKRLTK